VFVPEHGKRQPDREVSANLPHLSIHEIAERLNISVEAAYALVKASLRGTRGRGSNHVAPFISVEL
jgi:hypothetical protein